MIGRVIFCLTLTAVAFGNAEETQPVSTHVHDSHILIHKNAKPLFQYNIKPTAEAADSAPHFSRSGYIHPLYSPSGKIVTGDYAADHRHQHGLFFAWTKSNFRGKPTEFWNQAKKSGDIRFSRLGKTEKTNDSEVHIFEQIFTSGKGSDEAILKETWRVEIPSEKTPYFQFDLTSTQTCATEAPLTIEKYHYGGMAIRGNDQWLAKNEKKDNPPGKMITSEGKTRSDGNHSRPNWVAMYGPVDDELCGVAVMCHPKNFRAPQWVRLHPSKPYFVWAPMVEEPFQIKPEQPYVSRFRYVTFDGEPDLDLLDKIWQDFASQK